MDAFVYQKVQICRLNLKVLKFFKKQKYYMDPEKQQMQAVLLQVDLKCRKIV